MEQLPRKAEPGPRALGAGAARAAPTAPHATPRTWPRKRGEPRSGPERFWARWPVRAALGAGLLASTAAHCSVLPFGISTRFEVQEVEGDVAIPVDLLTEERVVAKAEVATPPASPPEPASEPKGPSPAPERPDSATPAAQEAGSGARSDASDAGDASADSTGDSSAADATQADEETPSEASAEGSLDGDVPRGGDGGDAEAGAPSRGPRDPESIVGAAGAVQADVVLVMLIINAEVIRTHPVGARLGFLLKALPQWNDFMGGTEIDPVRDVDWVMISGPSLLNTSRDVVLVHYSASDAVVDRAIGVLGRRSEHGGTIDAGARGVRAVFAHADRADRVILRTQTHVVAVVPPAFAQKIARQLVAFPVRAHIRPGEALYLRVVDPHHPMPELPGSLKELRLQVLPRDDGGADVFIEGDTSNAEEALQASAELKRVVRRHNDAITSLVTGGILDHVDIRADQSEVKLHLAASRAQIERLAELAGDFLGVAPEGTGAPSRPSPGAAPVPGNPRGPRSPR